MNRTAVRRSELTRAGLVPEESLFGGAEPEQAGPGKAPLEVLVRYIPTEAIVLYVALLGAVGTAGSDYTGRWVALAIFLVATPVLVFCDWAIEIRRIASRRTSGGSLLAFNLVAATIGFAAWAFSLPASPFSDFSWYDQSWAGFAALLAAVAIGKAEGLILPLHQD